MKHQRIGLALILIGLSLVVVGISHAGDDRAFVLRMSIDAGMDSICSVQLLPERHYAIQPTVNAYVAASPQGDGGTLWDGGSHVNSESVEVGAKKLYDIWTTADKRFICCKPSAVGAESACKGYLYRQGTGP